MLVTQEEQRIDIESMRDALMQAVAGYAQALPALVQNGQDPSQAIMALAKIVEGRQAGEAIEKIVAEAFAPPEPSPAPEQMAPEMMGGQPAPGEATGAMGSGGGIEATGRMPGVAPGQQGMAPGGRPSLQTLLAGLSSSGQPMLSGSVMRRTPV